VQGICVVTEGECGSNITTVSFPGFHSQVSHGVVWEWDYDWLATADSASQLDHIRSVVSLLASDNSRSIRTSHLWKPLKA